MAAHAIYSVEQCDYEKAGSASAAIKQLLRQEGIDKGIVRRVAIAAYEAEINLIIHSEGGKMELTIDDEMITLEIYDRGPGISDVMLVQMEGFSTACDVARNMGFGAGMGIPNMRRNADSFVIASRPNIGTLMVMKFNLNPQVQDEANKRRMAF